MIQVSAKGDWRTPDLSKAYPAGSAAKTSATGPMRLQFDPKNIFRLLPGAEIIIRAPREEGKLRRVALELKSGQVDLTLDQVPKSYQIEVRTPTAICGAVGTSFSVSYLPGIGLNQKFACSRGSVYAHARDDAFAINRLSAGKTVNAQVLPGKENSANSLHLPSGVTVNIANSASSSQAFATSGATRMDVAKDIKSKNQALIVVRSGKAGNLSAGAYLMEGGSTTPVSSTKKSTADQYWDLSKKEGVLKARIDAGERGLESELNRVAAEATKKRQELFDRALIRDTVRDSIPRGGRP